MSIARASIIRGPAIAKFNGATIFSKDDIETTEEIQTFVVPSSIHGKADERVSMVMSKVRITPVGEYESTAILWPYAAFLPGQSIFGADKTLTIQTLAGQKLVYQAAAITGLADIDLSATKTLIGGPIEFTCIRKDNTAWSTAASFLDISTLAFPGGDYATFDRTNIKTQPYALAWGATAPFDAIKTKDGTKISFDLSIEPVEYDDDGLVDFTFADLGVMAKFTPVNFTEADMLKMLSIQDSVGGGTLVARGKSLSANQHDLVATGTGVTVTIKNAVPKTAGYRFGSTALRSGEIGMVALRSFNAGVGDPLYTLA
jgi:hypothetical protein